MIEELREQAKEFGISVDPNWDEPKLSRVVGYFSGGVETMNAYAMRIWEGQSPDNPRELRVERIKEALTAQGWGPILCKLELPVA